MQDESSKRGGTRGATGGGGEQAWNTRTQGMGNIHVHAPVGSVWDPDIRRAGKREGNAGRQDRKRNQVIPGV